MAGRPSVIDHPVRQAADGEIETVQDRVVAAIRAGNYVETAAAAAGVNKDTLYTWLRTGARAGTRQLTKGGRLTAYERKCRAFSDAVAAAVAESELTDVARLAQLARGGLRQTTVTVKVDRDGQEVERTTKDETALPHAAVLMWRLERRFGDRWGRAKVEVSGPDGGPILHEVAVTARAELAASLEEINRRLSSPILELEGEEE